MDVSFISEALKSATDRLTENNTNAALGVAGGVIALTGVYFLFRSRTSTKRSKPRGTELGGGNIDRKAVRKAFVDYSNSYGKDAGVGIVDRNQTPGLVDTFYNLVTDFYEWGWGESFHFSVPMPGKTEMASEAANEGRIATLCNLRPGMKCIDCGCGVGGPMRTVAAFSGAEVIGVTINQYQVDRANYHNRRYGLESLCKAVHGTFLNLDFPDNSFDAAYACEATCHAPEVSKAYGEIFRVVKPGSIFVSYEWVTTPLFDPTNAVHVKAIDDINYGNGLPELRSAAECIEAAKSVGFELVMEYDLALESKVCDPWYVSSTWPVRHSERRYARLAKVYSKASVFNRFFVNFMSALHLLPSGMKQVHDMLLYSAAEGLITGGKEGIFTPMHLLVFRKPDA